jgi:hypothetical protein
MKNVLPFLVAAAPGVLILAYMRSISRERRSAEREVERLIAELDELLARLCRHSTRRTRLVDRWISDLRQGDPYFLPIERRSIDSCESRQR